MEPLIFADIAREIFIETAVQNMSSPPYEPERASAHPERTTQKSHSPSEMFFGTYSKNEQTNQQQKTPSPNSATKPAKKNAAKQKPQQEPAQKFDFKAQYRELDRQRSQQRTNQQDHEMER